MDSDNKITPELESNQPTTNNPSFSAVNPGSPAAPSSSQFNSTETPKPVNISKKSRLAVILIAVAAFVMAGSAAAYYAVIVPAQPESVLKTALFKTLDQRNASFAGTFNIKQDDTASKITFKGKGDVSKKVGQLEADITVSGVKVPIELRAVNNNFYVKFGDLGSVKGIAALTDPILKAYIDQIASKLSNQWIEIDSTLADQAGVSCYEGLQTQLTPDDKKLLTKLYNTNSFAKIKSTSSDTVNGKSAIKYEMELDDNKGAEYVKGLDQLSFIKKIKECNKDTSSSIDTKDLADGDITPLTIWVDKESKLITKLATRSTEQDKKKDNTEGDIELTINYEAVDVTKPEGAKPVMEVIGEFAPLFQQGLNGEDLPGSFEDVLGAFDIQ